MKVVFLEKCQECMNRNTPNYLAFCSSVVVRQASEKCRAVMMNSEV